MSLLGCVAFALLFSLVSAQSYEYYYYPTWPIYTAVILVFSIIVSIIGACCRRRAIMQRQQRLQAALAVQQATVHYPTGAYPPGLYPPGTYPPPPGAYPSSAPPGSYPTAMPVGGPTSNLPPYPGAGAMPMDGFANMGYASTADQDMFKPPPYSQITSDFPEHSKPVGVNGVGPASHVDVPPPPAYEQAAIPPAAAATSSQTPDTAPPTVPQWTQQPPQPRQF